MFKRAIFSLFLVSLPLTSAYGAKVQACKNIKQSRQASVEKTDSERFCTIRPALGEKGEYVEIKNDYNYIVAVGRIVKTTRTSSSVVLTKHKKDLGSMAGFSVKVRDNDSQDFWTATTAPF